MRNNTVVKVGGSFQSSPPALRCICETLDRLSNEYRFLVVPGGGQFADLVREFQSRYDLSNRAAHRMAVLSMDIFGHLLNDFLPGLSVVSDLREVFGGCYVFLPFASVKSFDIGKSWEITSDSISAWICGETGFKELLLIKRIDGIFDQEIFREKISTGELRKINHPAVDQKLPDILDRFKLECTILNGEYPERISNYFEGDFSRSTRIIPEV